jgi:anti-sigma regulatory factor (Ser/Thr protein kinase)
MQTESGVDADSLRLTLRNQLSDLGAALSAFDAFADALDVPVGVSNKVRLALDEVLSNILRHAFPPDGPHEIQVSVRKRIGRLTVTIEDDGVPFDPTRQAPVDIERPLEEREVGGLGIHLVRGMMDEVVYRRQPNGNRLTLIKRLGSAAVSEPTG